MRIKRFMLNVILNILLNVTLATRQLSTQNSTDIKLTTSTSTQEDENVSESSFHKDEIGWSVINEEVEMVIPLVLTHLQKLGIEHLRLPDLTDSIPLGPLFGTYGVGLQLKNGIVYNVDSVRRYGDALMTYEDRSFLIHFYLNVASLQFEYNFVLQLMPLEGYGKAVGNMVDTLIYAELEIKVNNPKLKVRDFRVIKFRNIHVQLDQHRIIREVSGLILSPITNLFRERITTSISDGLKGQMQVLIEDFNNKDPLELRKFSKQVLSGLTGQTI